jgi:hypothetical protein
VVDQNIFCFSPFNNKIQTRGRPNYFSNFSRIQANSSRIQASNTWFSLHILFQRYKSFLLSLGKQFCVLSLSFNSLWCSLFKMCMQISMYLSHWLLHIGLRQSYLLNNWIKLAPSSIGISFLTTTFRFGLAYNHYVTLRLLEDALISINPLFLLISLCFKKVLGINSFYYEFS